MQIADFIDLMLEPELQLISVYDLVEGKEIYHGDASEIPHEISVEKVTSIDTVEGNKITFNIFY